MRTPLLLVTLPALAALLLGSACGRDDGADPSLPEPHAATTADAGSSTADAGPADAGPGADLELGIGETDFAPLAEGQQLDLVQAPQGGGGAGAHFWVALRTHGVAPHAVDVHLHIRRVDDGVAVSDVERREDLEPQGDAAQLVGLRAVISQCADVAGQALELTAEVVDARGVKVSDARRFRGPESCPRTCVECDGL